MARQLELIQTHRVEPPSQPVAQLFGAHRMAQPWKIDHV